MKGRRPLITPSLAEAEPRVVMATSREKPIAFAGRSKRWTVLRLACLSLWKNSMKTWPFVASPPMRLPSCRATLTRPPPL